MARANILLTVLLANVLVAVSLASTCTELQESRDDDLRRKAVFKSVSSITDTEFVAHAMIMFFVRKADVYIQLWDPVQHGYKLEWSMLVSPQEGDEKEYQEKGYRLVKDLDTPVTIKTSYQQGVYSSDMIPLNLHYQPNAPTIHLGSEILPTTGTNYTFDPLPMPFYYQVCFCKKKGCADLTGDNSNLTSEMLTEKRIITQVLVQGPPGAAGPSGPQGIQGPAGPPGRDSPSTGALMGGDSKLLTEETMIGIMLWLGVLTLLMIVVLAVLMVICVGNRRNSREKSRLGSQSDSTQNIKEANGDWNGM